MTAGRYCCSCSSLAILGILSIQALLLILAISFVSMPTATQTKWRLKNVQQINQRAANPSVIGVDSFPDLVAKFAVPKYSNPKLPRTMKEHEYGTMMRLVRLTVDVFERNNISYALAYGSLIGSYLMHDPLPWDDDVDIFIHNDSKARAIELFEGGATSADEGGGRYGIGGYYYPESPGEVLKIFFRDSPSAGGYEWNWPFIDIVSYVEIDNTVKAVDMENITVFKGQFFPFHKRPFGPLWLNSPKDPVALFRAKYKSRFQCATWTWNHKSEKHQRKKDVPCRLLMKSYPVVKRAKHGNRTLETLMLNGKEFYKVLIDEAYRKQPSLYGW